MLCYYYILLFSFCRLLFIKTLIAVYEDTCKDGDSDAYKCVYVIVQSRQKRKSALLSHRKRRCTHIGLLFEFQRLKISCFKTEVLKKRFHATDVGPRLGTSSSFCPGCSFSYLLLSPLHVSWWAAYKDRSHSNDQNVLP